MMLEKQIRILIEQYEKEYRKDREETSKQLDKIWYEAGPRPRKGWKGH